jgi:hypothetical protein
MRQPLARVRLLGGSKRHGRVWTPGICSHRLGSGSGGAPTLSNSLQQAPIHSAAVAGHSLPDALRGLDLSRGRGAVGEHRELRQTLGLLRVPDFTTLYRFLKRLGAQSVIPAPRGKKTWRVRGVRAEMRRAFPRKLYRRRALIETVFSSVKRKLSARAPGHSLRMQMRQALLLGLSFNLYRLRNRYFFPEDVNRAK